MYDGDWLTFAGYTHTHNQSQFSIEKPCRLPTVHAVQLHWSTDRLNYITHLCRAHEIVIEWRKMRSNTIARKSNVNESELWATFCTGRRRARARTLTHTNNISYFYRAILALLFYASIYLLSMAYSLNWKLVFFVFVMRYFFFFFLLAIDILYAFIFVSSARVYKYVGILVIEIVYNFIKYCECGFFVLFCMCFSPRSRTVPFGSCVALLWHSFIQGVPMRWMNATCERGWNVEWLWTSSVFDHLQPWTD